MRAKDTPFNVNLYTNTVLDGCVTLCVCPFNIETTFPLSNFETKHIFGILIARVKFLNPQIVFFYHHQRWRKLPPQFFFCPNFLSYHSFTTAEGGGFQNGRWRRAAPGKRKAASPEGEGNPTEGGCFASLFITEFLTNFILIKTVYSVI